MLLQPSQMVLPGATPKNGVVPNGTSKILQPNQLSGQQPQASQPTEQPQGAQLKDTGSFLGNAANSAGNFLGSIVGAVTHPIDTVTNIGKGLIGAGENLASGLTTGNFSAAETKGADQFTQVADNIGSFIKQRYGSIEAAKQTAYQDPVGFLADASVVLGGAGGAVGKVGELSDASKVVEAGNMISKVGEAVNPLNLAGKGMDLAKPITEPIKNFAGKQVSNLVGAATGAGGSSISEGLDASLKGNKDFINAARGNISDTQIIDTAQQALDNLKQAKNTTYQQQLQAVKGVSGEIDYQPAVNEFRKQLADNGITVKSGELQFEGARGFQNPSEQAVLQNAYDKIERWGDVPANNTLYGLDTLKQQLGDFIGQSQGKAKPVITQASKVLSDILKQNPEYKNLVEPYETTSKLIDEMKTVVAKNPETALKKLTKAVSQDNSYRQSLIDELNKYTPNGENLKTQLAGLNMKSWTNNSKLFTYGEIGTALFNPHLLPAFIASSPRAVAEFLNAMGYSASKIDSGLSLLKEYKSSLNSAGRLKASQANPVQSPSSPSKKSKAILIKSTY